MAVEVRGGQVIVSPSKEVDFANVAEFESLLDEAAGESRSRVVIDLTGTSYMDTAGVRAIVAAYGKVTEAGGTLVIVTGNPLIRSVLNVVHLEQLPSAYVFDDLDSALNSPLPPGRGSNG